MNVAEVEFLQAMAIEMGIGTVPGTAAEHYNAGVRAAMQMYPIYDASLVVTDAQVDAYLATYPYGGGGVTGGESPEGAARPEDRRPVDPRSTRIRHPGTPTATLAP